MAGLLARVFGIPPKTAIPDPCPGIGGYTDPPGPAGQTGYPGSTSATRANPRTAWKNLRRGTPYTGIQAQQAARQGNAGEYHGGMPFGGTLSATGVGEQYQDTEQRSRPVLSAGVPGGQRQRNTTYYGGLQAQPDGRNRYVFGGTNGGVESYSMDRRMPYAGHGTLPGHNAKNMRGADLSGTRFTMQPPVFQPQRSGYGTARTHQRNRPTIFTEPAPWTSQFYDTTAATGGPDTPGTPAAVQNVYVSPAAARRTSWRRRG